MNKKEIDSILTEYSETEMIKKCKVLNIDNKKFTLVVSTGQVISSFTSLAEFRKFLKELKKKQ
jgi:hypothetical protein